jgi:hypothetical protein
MHRAVNWSVFMQGVNTAEVVNKVSVSDKMKFFEKAMEQQNQPSPKTGKLYKVTFTYGRCAHVTECIKNGRREKERW